MTNYSVAEGFQKSIAKKDNSLIKPNILQFKHHFISDEQMSCVVFFCLVVSFMPRNWSSDHPVNNWLKQGWESCKALSSIKRRNVINKAQDYNRVSTGSGSWNLRLFKILLSHISDHTLSICGNKNTKDQTSYKLDEHITICKTVVMCAGWRNTT